MARHLEISFHQMTYSVLVGLRSGPRRIGALMTPVSTSSALRLRQHCPSSASPPIPAQAPERSAAPITGSCRLRLVAQEIVYASYMAVRSPSRW
jgi:hypothetical protein